MAPISAAPDDDDGRFANSNQFGRWVLHTDANRIPGSEMHPVESTPRIGQTGLEAAHNVRVWSHAETHAVHDAR
jgi:hypothetical protein